MRNRTHATQGLTLSELLVALFLLIIVTTALSNVLVSSMHVNRQSRQDQAVTVAAEVYVEQSRIALRSNVNQAAPAFSGTGLVCTSSTGGVPPTASSTLMKRVTLRCTLADGHTQHFTLDFGQAL